jgi:hypothetical protein
MVGGQNDLLGSAGAPAGRVNRDSVEDFVITASGFDHDYGKIYVRAGGSGALIFAKEGRALGLDRAVGFGDSVARTPGDFDGDGSFDIAVAAPRHAAGNGRIYIWSGRRPRRTLLFKETAGDRGDNSGGWLGASMTFADVNHDGFSDLIAGEHGRGRVHVWLGPGADGHAIPRFWVRTTTTRSDTT